MHYLANEKTPKAIDTLVIYLHGFPDTCWLWEQQLRSGLSSKAHLIALDLPGCGGSDNHSFYGPDEILNAVAEAISQLKRRYMRKPSVSGSPLRSVLVSHDWYLHWLLLSCNRIDANMLEITGVEQLLSVLQVRRLDWSTSLLSSIPPTYDCRCPSIEMYANT